jgi:hypothetical protein
MWGYNIKTDITEKNVRYFGLNSSASGQVPVVSTMNIRVSDM